MAIMVEQKNDIAVKFLLDKLANPHLVFGTGHRDACDLAKENGLDKRFFVFQKCTGEHKVYPADPVPGSATDHRKELVMATTDFGKIIEQARQLDQQNEKDYDEEEHMERMKEELRHRDQWIDTSLQQKQQQKAYTTKRFDMIDEMGNKLKAKVQDELEEYKKKFQIPEQEVKLAPFSYPDEIAKEMQLKMEADRVRRQIEFDRLEDSRKKAVETNKETAKKLKFDIMAENQDLNQKLEGDYSNYMEVELREQFLIDERIRTYRLQVDQNRAEQLDIVHKITTTTADAERKRQEERSKRVNEEKEAHDMILKVEQKKQEILNMQEMLHKNAQEQRQREKAIEKERRDVWNELTGIRKQIDYDQVKMEALHLKKQVENDFLEKEIQDRIRQARLALDLAIDKQDAGNKHVDNKINIA